MAKSPVEVVKAILANPTDLASVRELVAPDATYVSLNYDNPELKRIMPWDGEFRGHAGYEDWARQMSAAFDRLAVTEWGPAGPLGREGTRSGNQHAAAPHPSSFLAGAVCGCDLNCRHPP